MNNDTDRAQDDRTGEPGTDNRADQQPPRRNPRIVIGSLDFFEMLMEQDEEQ